MDRIEGEEPVEQGCSRARQPHDEQRPVDTFIGDFGMTRAMVRETQAMDEQLEHLTLGEITPKGIERRVGFEGLEEAVQSRAKRLLTEVIEAGSPARDREKRRIVQTEARHAEALERSSGAIQRANR